MMDENPKVPCSILPLNDIFPGNPDTEPAEALQAFFGSILIRTNFVPVARHVIGWRGLNRTIGPPECWTAKIKGHDGVFGATFTGFDREQEWVIGGFALHYFPHPDEELVELIPLKAVALTQDHNYMEWLREFCVYPHLAEFFRIAEIIVGLHIGKKGVVLGHRALTLLRGISEVGVSKKVNGHKVVLIEPGGIDFDVPAFAISSSFFDVMASSLSFNLEQGPAFLCEKEYPGTETFLDATGKQLVLPAENVRKRSFMVGYGTGDFTKAVWNVPNPLAEYMWTRDKPIPYELILRPWWYPDRLHAPSALDRKTMGLDGRPPLIILTGFLGSGKTSFLQRLIEFQTQRSCFVAVIQNEIGEIGLDGKMLDYKVTEIDEGCVCCSLAGSLKRAVHAILSDFQPDCIVVETTGLANPLRLQEEMKELEDQVRLDCTLTIVDAVNAARTLSTHHIATDQVRAADIIMLNKKDLVDQQQIEAVKELVRAYNPYAPIFSTANGDLHPSLILDAELQPTRSSHSPQKRQLFLSHCDEGLWSESVCFNTPLERNLFLQTVENFPVSVFRAKGVIEFTDSPQPMLFQYVAGRYEISVFAAQADPGRFITLIGQGGESNYVANIFMTLFKTTAPAIARNGSVEE